ncbi:hypothetical protein ACIGXM_15740 [Kitasatospora sp. NPDC052896]|uniref:hypothetical protein n=1 Tax=Kitasatospora sp. NPDC052896 TaxID=3364061 RepID=UPI0037CAC94F
MTSHEALDRARPVEISALVSGHRDRQVRIERPGTTPVVVACSSRQQFEEVLRRERPDLDPDDAQQLHWVDHPGEWPGA